MPAPASLRTGASRRWCTPILTLVSDSSSKNIMIDELSEEVIDERLGKCFEQCDVASERNLRGKKRRREQR